MQNTANYNFSKPVVADTVGVTIPALSANFALLDTMDMVIEKVIGATGYIKYKSGLIIQWGVEASSGIGSQQQYSTTGIYQSGFSTPLSKALTHIIGGGASANAVSGDRIWNSQVVYVSSTVANFQLMCLGNVMTSTSYNWWVMGY